MPEFAQSLHDEADWPCVPGQTLESCEEVREGGGQKRRGSSQPAEAKERANPIGRIEET